MKALSLFSGCGGMDVGFQDAGFNIVASNEVHPTICDTLRGYFDHDILDKSIHLLSAEKLRSDYGLRRTTGEPYVIFGGFPCPVYSRAADIHGTRVGVRTIDNPYKRYAERGGALFLEYWRQVAILQPDAFVIENVAGLQDANLVLETFNNTPCNNGRLPYYYKLHAGILRTHEFGLPQRRDRFYFVAARKEYSLHIEKPKQRRQLVVGDIIEENPTMPYTPEILTLPETGEKVTVIAPEYAKSRLLGLTCRDRPIITEAGPDAIAPTVVAHYAKDKGTRLIRVGSVVRPYTVRECARLQGLPDEMEIVGSEYMQYVQVGNAVPSPVANAIARGLKESLNN